MPWNEKDVRKASGQVTITIKRNGGEEDFEYEGSLTVGEALKQLSEDADVSSFTVKDAEDKDIEPTDAAKTLSEVGELSVYPKAVGA